mmetsp:Transcript_28164/g.54896  ORF Transcript_28164/g.54896 Transcript_28164/m.54896 type:complete len:574 (-) Transcript_28164:394-2115(-)
MVDSRQRWGILGLAFALLGSWYAVNDLEMFSDGTPKVASIAEPYVDAPCGLVTGFRDKAHGVDVFYAIPYALAPIGDRRFMPPVRAKRWPSARKADKPGPFCKQVSPLYDPPKVLGSEDCLTADVYVPSGPTHRTKTYPVLVFIHGGDLSNLGSSFYPMTAAAEHAQVIFVSLQYRLGAFGFMALRELAETDPRGVSGNFGILDMQMGLGWVRDNIAAFGGDARRITLMGQSSGGTAVYALLASPASKGLFHQAIVMSGSPNLTMSLPQAYRQNEGFIHRVGCNHTHSKDVLKCLQSAPADVILHKTSWDLSGEFDIVSDPRGRGSPGMVVADGVTVLRIETALETGLVDVPLIVSSNEDEMDFSPARVVEKEPRKTFLSEMDDHLKAWGHHFGSRIMETFYSRELSVSPQWALDVFLTDLAITCGNDRLAKLAAKGFKSPVYRVMVTQRPVKPIPTAMVPGFTMRYTFHNWDLFCGAYMWDWSPLFEIYPTKDDLALSHLLKTSWKNLTTTGKVERYQRISQASRSLVTNLVGGLDGNPTSPTVLYPELDFKREVCSYFEQLSMGKSFWWSD